LSRNALLTVENYYERKQEEGSIPTGGKIWDSSLQKSSFAGVKFTFEELKTLAEVYEKLVK